MSDITTLLPEKLVNTALVRELSYYLDSVRDYDVAESPTNVEGIDQRVDYVVSEILNKYKDPTELSFSSLTQIFAEHGYGYTIDVLNLSNASLISMVGFIPLIHALKGSRRGLELVFDLLIKGSTSEYSLVEWWEDPDPTAQAVGSAIIELTFDASLIKFDTFDKLKLFLKSYVYCAVVIRVLTILSAQVNAFVTTETKMIYESTPISITL